MSTATSATRARPAANNCNTLARYTDFCLGDTGAMPGHSPDAVVAAVHQRLAVQGGVTTMMPTEDAAAVSADLCRRFGQSFLWSFTLSATDANRAGALPRTSHCNRISV